MTFISTTICGARYDPINPTNCRVGSVEEAFEGFISGELKPGTSFKFEGEIFDVTEEGINPRTDKGRDILSDAFIRWESETYGE